MERKLFIIRHEKSSWEHAGLDDIDRPLAERGIRNAGEMARRLQEKGEIPQLILTSPASRALNTALIMSKVWGLGPECLQVHEPLYDALLSEIAQVLAAVPPEVKGVAIFGHNPSFTSFTNQFMKIPLDNLPTAGVALITLESDSWNGIGRNHVIETYVDYPKRK